ncbi:hypothetical protein AKO1_007215 [Acrasis kona]|uniref:Vomeronasal type-1 receptor n=1 Tax=Acrasis kona TaxID=1008807 RepID=A0AAW2YTC2_9EUKA
MEAVRKTTSKINKFLNVDGCKNLFIFRTVFDIIAIMIWSFVSMSQVYNLNMRLCPEQWKPEYCASKAQQLSMGQAFGFLLIIPSILINGATFLLLHRKAKRSPTKVTPVQTVSLHITFVHTFLMIVWILYASYFGLSGFSAAPVFMIIFNLVTLILIYRNRRELYRRNQDADMYATSNQELINS